MNPSMTQELQQSDPYVAYMKALHWRVETIDGIHIYYRHFPLWGGFAKMQRFNTLPHLQKIQHFIKTKKIKRFVIESGQGLRQDQFFSFVAELKKYVTVASSPYLASKTLILNPTLELPILFNTFTEAKKRAVKRAIKNHVHVIESNNVEDMIFIKNKSAGLFGFITTSGLKQLWESFGTHHTRILLAYTQPMVQDESADTTTIFDKTQSLVGSSTRSVSPIFNNKQALLGGIFLIFWGDTAYYWIAGATKNGKKLAAPTLLVWEALKVAKANHMKQFDFVGIWDDRFPKESKDWLGFTKFKQGFGGKIVYYPIHRTL